MPPRLSVDLFSYITQICRTSAGSGCALPLLGYLYRHGLQTHTLLCSSLFTAVANLGCIQQVLRVRDPFAYPHRVLWCSLLQEYAQQGLSHRALTCFQIMQERDGDFKPCAHTLVALLKACARLRELHVGMQVHGQIAASGLDKRNVFVGTALVDMYAKCGCLLKAQEVFDQMLVCNAVTWTAMIAGCIEQGCNKEAMSCYEQMRHKAIVPDLGTFVCILKGCSDMKELRMGQEINAEIVKKGLHSEIFLGNTLIDMYSRCGCLVDAQAVFDALKNQDLVSWNALLSGYVENGLHEVAAQVFERMLTDEISPNETTYVCILKAFGCLGVIENCREKHQEVVKNGLFDDDLFIASVLIDVYSKCGSIVEARKVLSSSMARDIVSWNAMIGGCVEHGFHEEALGCLKQMETECIALDACSYIYVLRACRCLREICTGCNFHAELVKQGLEKEPMIGRSLVDMYANLGLIESAQNVLDNIPSPNGFIWDALVIGYMELEDHKKVLSCFERMEGDGIPPKITSLTCRLESCAQLGVIAGGQLAHMKLAKEGIETEGAAGNALVDMYISCGFLVEAEFVFGSVLQRNVILFTTLMAGYAQLGYDKRVFRTFNKMKEDGHMPDLIMLLIILNACSHVGLLDEGERCFIAISADFFLVPTSEHFTCMVDLCGRSGDMMKAVSLLENMPYHPGLAVWNSMLWACLKSENSGLAKGLFGEALQVNEEDTAAYISMSNICANFSNRGAQQQTTVCV